MILLTFNKSLIKALITLFLFSACSSRPIKEVKVVKKRSEKKAKVERPKLMNSGPSLKKSKGRFVEITKKLGLAGEKAVHLYAVDWSGDGHTDLVSLEDYYSIPRFFRFNPKLKKFEKELKLPFHEALRASYLVFEDFNKDGLLDCLVGVLNQKTELTKRPLRLFTAKRKNKTIVYEEVKNAFPERIMPTSSVSVTDFDLDGELDLYLANWFDLAHGKAKIVPDRLYKGKKGIFEDYSAALEKEHRYSSSIKGFDYATPSFGVSSCDVDQNGYPDFMTAASAGYPNRLWMNLFKREEQRRTFKDYGEVSLYSEDKERSFGSKSGGNSFYSTCADYDNDGIVDLALGELFHTYDPETRDRPSILKGLRREFPPKFSREEYHKDDGSGSWSQGDRHGLWYDYNFDGKLDLLVDNSGFPPKSRTILFEQKEGYFEDVAKSEGVDIVNPSGSVLIDIDGDGRRDLISGQTSLRGPSLKPRIYAFQNKTTLKGKKILWLKLKGKEANLRGLGASILVKTSLGSYLRFIHSTVGGLPSQSEDGVSFSFKKKEVLKSVEVRWPLLKKGHSGRSYPLVRKYKIKDYLFKKKQVLALVLCEKGSFGREDCRN